MEPADSAQESPPRIRFLFDGLALGGPLEEFDAVVAKKVRTHASLGDEASTIRLNEAALLAREKLSGILAAPRARAGETAC